MQKRLCYSKECFVFVFIVAFLLTINQRSRAVFALELLSRPNSHISTPPCETHALQQTQDEEHSGEETVLLNPNIYLLFAIYPERLSDASLNDIKMCTCCY